jgi:ABC-type bacteriocin/lantibiotic exporter with double-glycine peptidase domain
MNKADLDTIHKYLSEQGLGTIGEQFQLTKNSRPRTVIKELIEENEHPLIKTDLIDVEPEEGSGIPSTFIAVHNEKVYIVRKVSTDTYLADGSEDVPPLGASDCFAVRVTYRYADPASMSKLLVKRTPSASLLLLMLVVFVMASPVYSNLFNSRLVFGESVSSLLVVSGIFIIIFVAEYFLKEWVMAGLNRQIEKETCIAEDILFNKVIHSKNKDSIVHWKTATESIVQIWKAVGHIGLDALTAIVIMVAFMFMLGIYAIFPIAIYILFFVVQITMKMKAYRKILMLNQLRDQKLSYLIGLEKPKSFFKFINMSRIRRRWMGMTEDVSLFNIQITDHEEKSSGILKFYSSTSIVVIFIAAYFAIQMGHLQQSAVIALMLLNGRCSGAISTLSSRLYQSIIAHSKMQGAISSLHEDDDPSMFEMGVTYVPQETNSLTTTDLSMVYEDHQVFSGVDLSVKAGMSLAIIGKAGSGKSSLLRILAGHMAPTGGRATLNTVSTHEYEKGFYSDNVAYYSPEDRFVGDTLGFNAALKYGADLKTYSEALRSFGADFVLNQHAMYVASVDELNLSSGQYQLVKMITSLGKNPDLIVLDEPCSHLSPLEAQRFMTRLRERYPNAIIIYSSHSVMLTKQANVVFDMDRKSLSVNKRSA